jgi:uncharacterized membrane protein YphA (DoxX/SURF4 family)
MSPVVGSSSASSATATGWREPSAIVALLCRLATGVIFVYASLDKLAHPGAFAEMVHNYRLVPLALLNSFALLLPAVEVTVGIALLVGILRRGAALLATLMMLAFTVAVVAALIRGLDISCGCFSTENGHTIETGLLIRDLLMLAMAAIPLVSPHPGWGLGDLLGRD